MQTQDFDDNFVNDVYNGKVSGALNQAPTAQPDTGVNTLQDESLATNAGDKMTFGQGFTQGISGTSEADLANLYTRHALPVDPDFNLKDNESQIMKGLPLEYWGQFQSVRSLQEAMELKSQIQKELSDSQTMAHAGLKGLAGYAVGALVDPVNLLGGSLFKSAKILSVTGKLGLAGTRLESVAAGVEAGAKVGAMQGALSDIDHPTSDFSTVVTAGLYGAGLGGITGAAFHSFTGMHDVPREQFDNALASTKAEFEEATASGQAGTKIYNDTATIPDKVFDTEGQQETAVKGFEQQMADLEVQHDVEGTTPEAQARIKAEMMDLADQRIAQLNAHNAGFNRDTVGAASIGKRPEVQMSEAQKLMTDEAHDYLDANNIKSDKDTAFPNTPMGNAARAMYNGIQKTPFATDFDRLYNSKSVVAQALAHKLYESAVGIFRNNKSASMLNDIYVNNIAHSVNANYPKMFNLWAADQKLPVSNVIAYNTPKYRKAFENAIHQEMQSRLHDGKSMDNVSPAIKEMADHIDNGSEAAANLLRGREGETPVRGAENLQPRSGWFPQRYSGAKVNSILAELGSKGKDILAETLSKQYQTLHGFKPEEALQFSKAVIRRAVSKEDSLDTNVMNMLDSEGSEYMHRFLEDSGIPKERVTELVESLKGMKAEKTKENFLKQRVDMDTRTQIPGTDKTLADIMNTDVINVWNGYARRAAGSAALARQGIQKGGFDAIFDTIKAEIRNNGGTPLSDDFYEGVKSQWTGGAVGGGVNPWVRRATQLTNLSILNGLGLTKLAEAGVNVAALGVDIFRTTAAKEVQAMFKGKGDVQAMHDLSKWLSPIEGEHMAMRNELMMDEINKDPNNYNEMGKYIDSMLAKGARVQGHITGFYAIQQLTQRIAIRGMMHKLGQFYKEGKLISENRLADMGLDAETSARIGRYFKDGTIEYEADGGVKALNPEKWNPQDFETFVVVLNRFTHQVVQRAMKGEDSIWMHGTVGSVFSSLKRFTFDSMQKQLLRNMKITDPVSMSSFMYGLATAASVYAARQVLNGNDKKQNAVDIAKGALTLSNMTSILPAFVDPIASMLGMTSYKIGESGNDDYGVLPVPPMFPTLNRLAKAPAAVGRMLTGTNNNADVYSAQAIPLIGNFVGMANIWNMFKADKPMQAAKATEPVPVKATKPAEAKQATVSTPKEVVKPNTATANKKADKKGKEVLKDLGAGQ